MTHISVIICIDVDPDGANVLGEKCYDNQLRWDGLEKKVPRVIDIMDTVKDSEGNPAKFSWFLRCDEQINKIYGEFGWIFKKYDYIWNLLNDRGDELSWHPHFWRWSEDRRGWDQEIEDIDWMLKCLDDGFHSFYKWSRKIPSVRMGWAYHNNQTMIKLNELGIRTDLSAIPGCKSEGKYISKTFCDCQDWGITSGAPYFPSREDYRIAGEDRLKILEIPMTVSRDPLVYALYGMAINNRFMSIPGKFPISLFKDPKKFFEIIKGQVRKIKHNIRRKHIGIYFHPTDLFSKNAYKLFKTNLSSLPDIMTKEKVTFSFNTANEASSRILDGS